MRNVATSVATRPQASGLLRRIGVAAVSGLLGMVFLYGVGFAQVEAAHNAAHDGRHSFAFPCH